MNSSPLNTCYELSLMNQHPTGGFMTAVEVSHMLRMPIGELYDLCDEWKFWPARRFGKSWRFSKNDILKLYFPEVIWQPQTTQQREKSTKKTITKIQKKLQTLENRVAREHTLVVVLEFKNKLLEILIKQALLHKMGSKKVAIARIDKATPGSKILLTDRSSCRHRLRLLSFRGKIVRIVSSKTDTLQPKSTVPETQIESFELWQNPVDTLRKVLRFYKSPTNSTTTGGSQRDK